MVEKLFNLIQTATNNGREPKASKVVPAAFVALPLDCIAPRCDAHQTNEGRGHLEDTGMNSKVYVNVVCFTFKKQNAFFPQTQREAAFNLAI